MVTLYELIPDADFVLALEPDELAGVALELIMPIAAGNSPRLHPTAFTSPEVIGPFTHKNNQVQYGMAEAWNDPPGDELLVGDCDGAAVDLPRIPTVALLTEAFRERSRVERWVAKAKMHRFAVGLSETGSGVLAFG